VSKRISKTSPVAGLVAASRVPGVRPCVNELLKYIQYQFPAVRGHIPLAEKIHKVWLAGFNDGVQMAKKGRK
jgi:hypothetical protein